MDASTAEPAPYEMHDRYFHDFLPGLLNQLLVEDLRELSCCFSFHLCDSADPPWRLVLTSGRLAHLGHDGPEPQCTYVCDTDTFLGVVTGAVHPQEAFFDRRIEMEGDLELALRLAVMLGPFFERFPFRP